MNGRRQRTNTTIPVARTAIIALWTFRSIVSAFQPHLLPSSTHDVGRRHIAPTGSITHLLAKPSKKSKLRNGGGFGSSSGGFGSKYKSKGSSAPVDPSKVRSVSGYTGSGTKVLADAANNFDRIRKLFGKDATSDVYVRSPLNDESTFWFVGKVIRMIEAESGNADGNGLVGTVFPTEEEAILSQKRLILEYAKNQLRPQNMGGPYAKNLELWSAPGDSEMDVVQNKVALVQISGSSRDLREGFYVKDVGYNPEIYVGEEQQKGGLRVVRDSNGKPVKPAFDIN